MEVLQRAGIFGQQTTEREKQEKLIDQLRTRLKDVEPLEDEEDFITSTDTLTRYLKARDWDMKDSEKLLRATIEWRRSKKPLQMDCRWCHDKPGYHAIRQVGMDKVGRPVIYSCFAQTSTRKNSIEDTVSHTCYLIEKAKLSMRPGVGSWVFIIDCSGMTINTCNPKLGYGVTQVMANHYPERLGLIICVNHSPAFHGVWQAIKVFLHPNTVAKMNLIRSKRKMMEEFQRLFPADLVEWLAVEVKANKRGSLAKAQKEFWKLPSEPGAHDPRGAPSYVEGFIEPLQLPGVLDGYKLVHRPHPNIVDALRGVDAPPGTPGERERACAAAAGCDDSDNDDDFDVVDEEEFREMEDFEIPANATPLHT